MPNLYIFIGIAVLIAIAVLIYERRLGNVSNDDFAFTPEEPVVEQPVDEVPAVDEVPEPVNAAPEVKPKRRRKKLNPDEKIP